MSTETTKDRQVPRNHLILIVLMVAAFALFFSYVAIMRHERLQSTGYDLGIYDQAMWNTAQGRLFEYTAWIGKDNWFAEPGSMLGTHVEPILFFIVPLYWQCIEDDLGKRGQGQALIAQNGLIAPGVG